MSSMVNPHDGLVSYQEALSEGLIHPNPTSIYKELTVLFDEVEDEKRLTYAYMQDGLAKGIAIYIMNGIDDGKPYFQVGYAVAEKFRNQGIAQKLLKMSIDELAHGFRQHFSSFYVEAVVSVSNKESQRVAEKVIGGVAEEIIDEHSGEPALRYTLYVAK